MAEQLMKFDPLFRFIQEQKVATETSCNRQVRKDITNNFIGKCKVHTVPDQMIVRDELEEKRRIRRAATLLTQNKKQKIYNTITYYYNTKLPFLLCIVCPVFLTSSKSSSEPSMQVGSSPDS